MATARKITDFMSSGTLAARPATPPGLGTGEIAIYYTTDTLHMFAYVGGAWVQIDSAGSAPTIVQVKSVCQASHATGITMGSAPVNGNLLVAFGSDQTSSPSIGTGWEMLQQASAANDGYGVAIKLAGAGESATQTPFSDSHQGTITLYEVNNAAGGLVSVDLAFSNTAVVETAKSTKASSGLVLGVFVNRTTTGPTSITGTGVSADAAGNATGVGRACAPFHISAPANGSNTVTANYATSQGGQFVAIALG